MTDRGAHEYAPDFVSPPGATLLEAINELGMSQAELALRLQRPKKTVNEIIKGKAQLTHETAIQLEAVVGTPAEFWLNLEAAYRAFLARREEDDRLSQGGGWARQFPIAAMAARGWIARRASAGAKVKELLRFFAVASPEAWDQTWTKAEVAFRRAKRTQGNRFAISAWLRRGEIGGQQLVCEAFSAKKFQTVLRDARGLTRAPLPDSLKQLVTDFRACGVAVIFTPEIPGCPVSGATRWLSPQKALVQVSLRYKSDDQLWFSIFHEAAHVVQERRTAVFLEDGRVDSEDEHDANRVAGEILIPSASMTEFVEQADFSVPAIKRFARATNVAAGVVVGRLQHDHHLPFSKGNRLKRKLVWASGTGEAQ